MASSWPKTQAKKDDEKVELDSTGQAVSYISLDQARVLALQHARDNRDVYGRRYAQRDLVWEELNAEESEDYYRVTLSYRPTRVFKASLVLNSSQSTSLVPFGCVGYSASRSHTESWAYL